jgi:hypothetical protein
MKPWKDSNGDPDTVSRRDAATEFLLATLQDGSLWDKVVRSESDAWTEFRSRGDIELPKDVKVICVDPNLSERDKLVVFIMPPKGSGVTSTIDPLAHWVAAWPPYGRIGSAAATTPEPTEPNPPKPKA